ncbi:MAG: hypothetical protein IJT58_02995, partial [Synergistaceae bacterium]|nr:hypothetical protein [Synergistaceae bacterium]
ICNATVKLASDVKEGSIIEVPVYAMGKYGDTDDKKLVIRVAPDENHKEPTIDNGDKSIEVIAGGTTSVTFSGQHIKNWDYDKNSVPAFIEGIEIKKNYDPNTGEVVLNVKDEASAVGQEGDIKIYAYNGAGKAVATPANLHVTVTAGEKYATPTIDGDETVTVVQGGFVTATFTGKHTRFWSVMPATSLDVYAFYAEPDYSQDPERCDIRITASELTEDGTYTANVYAFNPAGQMSVPRTLTVKIEKNAAHQTAVIDDDEAVSVAYGGSATAVFTASNARAWYFNDEEGLPEWINAIEFDFNKNPDNCKVTVTAMSDTSVTAGTTAEIEIYAYNGVGQRSEPRTLTVTLVNDDAHETPVIEGEQSVIVIKGGTVKAVFTGEHVRSWGYGTLPDAIKSVALDYETDPNRCNVLVTASEIAELGDYELTIYAYNAVGVRTESTLKITITEDTLHPAPVIYDDESVSVIPGGTAKAVFTGEHITSWRYMDLPDEVKSLKLDYYTHPNRCEVLVTASSNAQPSTTPVEVYLYAFSEIGDNASAVLKVTIIEDTSHPAPVIDEDESVTVIAGGTAKAVFTGKNIYSWKHGNLPDSVKAVDLNYSVDPDRCEALVTASSTAEAGTSKVTIYAYNSVGTEKTATLNVTVINDEAAKSYPAPVIDEDESVTVVPGGTARAVFTGSNVHSWSHGSLPSGVKAVVLKYDTHPDRCEVLITASSAAKAGNVSVAINAYNEVGASVSKTLRITIVEASSHPAPVIDSEGSVSVVPGGTSSTLLTGSNVASWAYRSLPSALKAIDLRYDSNPNRCEVLVTANPDVEINTDCSVTIYAYNSVGASADAALSVFIVDPDDSVEVPEFTKKIESASIVAGGAAASVFTAKNVSYWRHTGDLPSIVKAVEFSYDPEDASQCEVVVTTNSTAKEGDTASIRILAGNVYDEISTDIQVTIASTTSAAPVINQKTASITVAPGKSASTTFTGSDINSWRHGNLPDGVDSIELVYDTANPNSCEVVVSANALADETDGGSVKITAYSSAGVSADATLTVSISSDGDDGSDLTPFLNRHSSGCDMGFSALGLFALSMMLFKSKSKK